uniref:Slc2a-5 n=1 Tax=Schmidtea mediterranea TaxID=79327 RepID=A0A0H3YIU3_SCHMD|nr:slc2a-5 [Schmidtea mediterranea]
MVTFKLIYTIFTIVLGSSLQFGYQTGVVNAPLKIIENFIRNNTFERFNKTLTNQELEIISSVVVTIFPIGGLIGSLFGGIIANRYGRKLSMMLMAIPTAIGSVLMGISLISEMFPLLIVGRFIIGISCGVYSGLTPMYLTEIAPLKFQGASGTINQFVIVIGVLLSQIFGLEFILGNANNWNFLLGLSLIPCGFQIILLIFCPESPRYLLLTKNDTNGARRALQFLRQTKNVDIEIEQMQLEMENVAVAQKILSLREIFGYRYLRFGIFISVGMHLTQQLSGINSVIFYSDKIFEKANFTSTNANYATIGVGSTNLLITFLSVILVDKLGRKTLHLIGLSGMFIFEIFLSICLILSDHWQPLMYFIMVFIFLYVGSFGIGPGAIPWFIVAEMFTQESRAGIVSIAVFVNWTCQIVIGLGFPQLLTRLGNYCFLPFVVTLLISIVFTYWYVPETKGKTPEELENYLKRKVDNFDIEEEPLIVNDSIGPIRVDYDDRV